MDLKELITKNRSYRRFYEDVRISRKELEELVELARLSPSAKNLQHFKFHLASEKEICTNIFPLTAWAGYLKDWPGPDEGERPAAYITVLLDTTISSNPWHDEYISAQSILLGAVEKGFGGCIIASVKKKELASLLNLPAHLEILYIIALGKPKEIVKLEQAVEGNIIYYRDKEQVHHVPKRSLHEMIIN
ncbi:nitroreductase family protein [Bacteroidota bacterium]